MSDGTDYGQVAREVSKGSLVVMDPATGSVVATTADTIAGLWKLLESAGRTIGGLERRMAEEGLVEHEPRGSEITWLIDLWKRGCSKPSAKAGKTRVKMVKARLREKYPLKHDPDNPEPNLELAVIGLSAYPYRLYDKRYPNDEKAGGEAPTRDDDLSAALKDEKHVENLSRLGWQAIRDGYSIEDGWQPQQKGTT